MGERADTGGVVELVNDVLRRAAAAGASDVHFEPVDGPMRVRFRVDGALRDETAIPQLIAANVVARLKVLAGLLTYRVDTPQEGAIAAAECAAGCDVRVSTFPTIRGERAVLRLMAGAARFRSIEELGHDAALAVRLARQVEQPQGFVLIVGPAGSGKTTTLYALLDHIRRRRPDASIIAVEDPVEIRASGVTQVQIEPARGLTYETALRSVLRQDPQVLLIGEIRDAAVASIVVEAALSGHLLLASMHSGSPAEALLRLLEMGLPPYQLTSTIRGVLSQRLVRVASADRGRSAIGQLVEMTPALRRALLESGDAAALESATAEFGSLRADAERLIRGGMATAESIAAALGDS